MCIEINIDIFLKNSGSVYMSVYYSRPTHYELGLSENSGYMK